MTSAFKIEKEPTKQRDAEREIQENMTNLFETEADKGPADAENDPKTEDEKYAMEEFKKNLTFEKGMYLVEPILKRHQIINLSLTTITLPKEIIKVLEGN